MTKNPLNQDDPLTCTKCGTTKKAWQFTVSTKKSNGRHSWCRECINQSARARTARQRAAQRHMTDPLQIKERGESV